MADEKKSIFDLIDKFGGYDGSFKDNWLEKEFVNSTNLPKIIGFQVTYNANPTTKKEFNILEKVDTNLIEIPVIATLLIEGASNAAIITCKNNNQSKNVYPQHTKENIHKATAEFILSVPKSKTSTTGFNSLEYTFVAEIKGNDNKVVDTRTDQITANTKGNIVNSGSSEELNTDIKIVIDPGHGYTSGNTGAVSYIYTHKVKGNDDKPIENPDGTFKTESNDILKLPQYVIDDPSTWVISTKEDTKHNERGLVFDVSVKLKELLEDAGYQCLLTRDKKVIQGSDNSESRQKRIELANKNNANYFISIHADGINNHTSSGSHVIYPKTANVNVKSDCIQLAKDIFKFYNVVQVESSSPKEDVRGLQVLGSSNKTHRKVLVELGFVTTPRDAKALFENTDKVALQLYEGLIYNIQNSFQ